MSRESMGCDVTDDELRTWLHLYHIELPSEREVEDTVHHVLLHMAARRSVFEKTTDGIRDVMRHAMLQLPYIRTLYWIVSVLLFAFGAVGIASGIADPYITALYLSPLPFIFGVRVLFQNNESGVMEMEMACKYSGHQMLAAKLVVISTFNVSLNLCLFGLIRLNDSSVLYEKLLTLCLWPSLFLASVAFIIATSTRSSYAVGALVVSWTALTVWCVKSGYIFGILMNLTNELCLPVAIVSIGLIVLQYIRLKRGIVGEIAY